MLSHYQQMPCLAANHMCLHFYSAINHTAVKYPTTDYPLFRLPKTLLENWFMNEYFCFLNTIGQGQKCEMALVTEISIDRSLLVCRTAIDLHICAHVSTFCFKCVSISFLDAFLLDVSYCKSQTLLFIYKLSSFSLKRSFSQPVKSFCSENASKWGQLNKISHKCTCLCEYYDGVVNI